MEGIGQKGQGWHEGDLDRREAERAGKGGRPSTEKKRITGRRN